MKATRRRGGTSRPNTERRSILRVGAALSGQFFYPDAKPLSIADQAAFFANQWEGRLSFNGAGPTVRFAFHVPAEPMKILEPKLFDARTGVRLDRGSSYGHHGSNRVCVDFGCSIWHSAPVECMVDIAHGPVHDTRIAPRPGTEIKFPGGRLGLVQCLSGRSTSISISSGAIRSTNSAGRVSRVAFVPISTVTLSIDSNQTNEAVFVFLQAPPVRPVPIDVDVLDESGKLIPGAGSSSAGAVVSCSIWAPLSAARQIRVRYYSRVERFVTRLAAIPGLPSENLHVQNLFDVRIGCLSAQSAQDLLSEALDATELSPTVNSVGTTVPPGYFPRVYTNVSPRELVLEYERFASRPVHFVVDKESMTLVPRTSPLAWFRLELEKLLK